MFMQAEDKDFEDLHPLGETNAVDQYAPAILRWQTTTIPLEVDHHALMFAGRCRSRTPRCCCRGRKTRTLRPADG